MLFSNYNSLYLSIMDFPNSNSMKERAKKLSPHLTQTFSRSATSFVEGVYPVYVKSADGSHFIDVDNNKFLDYLLGLGPITLGYNYSRVNDTIIEQIKDPHWAPISLNYM